MVEQEKCKDVVREHYRGRMAEIRRLWKAQMKGSDEAFEDWNNYALAFDYVERGTFTDQKRGYFRYQISWGGPSDEFRFYCDERLQLDRVEYWYMDWFDGAKVQVRGQRDWELWRQIWDDWMECDVQRYLLKQGKEYTMNKRDLINGILAECGRPDCREKWAEAVRLVPTDPALWTDETLEAILVGICLANDPMGRGRNLWRYRGGHHRGVKVQRVCRLCGASCSWDDKYPRTNKSWKAELDDVAEHLADFRRRLGQRRKAAAPGPGCHRGGAGQSSPTKE